MRIAAVNVGLNRVAIAGPDEKRVHWDLQRLAASELGASQLGAVHSVLLARLQRFFERNGPDMIVIAPDVRRSVVRHPRDEAVVEQLVGVTLSVTCIEGVPTQQVDIRKVAALATGDRAASDSKILESARQCGEQTHKVALAKAYWLLRFAQQNIAVPIED